MSENVENKFISDDNLEKAIFNAMKIRGWILPSTIEEVQRAEDELTKHPITLPPSLADPYAVLDGPPRTIRIDRLVPNTVTAVENLAQAAREGGEISPEIKKQMEADRMKAETETDG